MLIIRKIIQFDYFILDANFHIIVFYVKPFTGLIIYNMEICTKFQSKLFN